MIVCSCALRTETEAMGPGGDQPFTLTNEQTTGRGRAYAQGYGGVWKPGLGYSLRLVQQTRRQEIGKRAEGRGRWE